MLLGFLCFPLIKYYQIENTSRSESLRWLFQEVSRFLFSGVRNHSGTRYCGGRTSQNTCLQHLSGVVHLPISFLWFSKKKIEPGHAGFLGLFLSNFSILWICTDREFKRPVILKIIPISKSVRKFSGTCFGNELKTYQKTTSPALRHSYNQKFERSILNSLDEYESKPDNSLM